MTDLKPYEVELNGWPTTLLLSEEDARARGLFTEPETEVPAEPAQPETEVPAEPAQPETEVPAEKAISMASNKARTAKSKTS